MKQLRDRIINEVNKVVVGQNSVIDSCIIALSVGGHVLLEGAPGTAKTLVAQAFAKTLGLDFKRSQFTPDMLPSDVTGTTTLKPGASGNYDLAFRPGPIFTNIFLADEINRTPPKTQAALLEAMQEQQVSADGVTHRLPEPFLVIATQNPIDSIVVSEEVISYVSNIVRTTRDMPALQLGASPRAAVTLLACAKAIACLFEREYVTPDDVTFIAPSVLRHRLILSPEAELERVSTDNIISQVLSSVVVPR